MKYKIFEIDKSFNPLLGELTQQCLLIEVAGVFDKDVFNTMDDAVATISRYRLNGRRYTVLPVFD